MTPPESPTLALREHIWHDMGMLCRADMAIEAWQRLPFYKRWWYWLVSW